MLRDIIINGNSLEEMTKIEAGSVDLIFADPPYWMRVEGKLLRTDGSEFDGCNDEWDQFGSLDDYDAFTERWLRECYRILKPNGTIWVIGGMQCIYMIGYIMQKIGFWFINDVVWHKKNPTPNFMGTRLNNSHETLIWAAKSKASRFTFNYKTAKELNRDSVTPEDYARGVRKQMGSVWRFPICSGAERLKDEDGKKLHSTQKPIGMLERIVAISTNIGDLVLDPFGGTMTTAVAAKHLGRHYVMIERDERYCRFGGERLNGIDFEDNEIAEATFDVRPIRVTVPQMIEAGVLKEGDWFSFKDGKPVAQLCENGKLRFNGEEIDMHTCAALARNIKAKRINGFDYWYVMRGGNLVAIRSIRDDYRKTLGEIR